jgi:ABC-type sugar transport system ATPase subunit
MTPPAEHAMLEMRGISKSYGGVAALRGVDFDVTGGEVVALVGQNGAGKSTLIKVLSGAIAPDAGSMTLGGKSVTFASPAQALAAGIATVYQDPHVYPELSVTENIFLGRELRTRLGNIDHRAQVARVAELLEEFGVEPALATAPIAELSLARRQLALIAKARSTAPNVIVFDEPTAILTERETQWLFDIINRLRARGVAIVYISHRLEEVFAIADRVTILKDGETKGTWRIGDVTTGKLIEVMAGQALGAGAEHAAARPGAPILEVRGLTRGDTFADVSFALRPGEIVGFFGLVGSGRSEVARAIFGEERADSGEILLDGRPVAFRSPTDAVKAGVCYLPEDRKGQGLFGALPVAYNETVVILPRVSWLGAVTRADRERDIAKRYAGDLSIKPADYTAPAATLSGGNQQKVVLAKWLAANPKIFILDEPTAGVDVAAKAEIHKIIVHLAQEKRIAVMVISSELPEVLALSDRVVVMHEGSISRTFPRGAAATDVLAAAMEAPRLDASAAS